MPNIPPGSDVWRMLRDGDERYQSEDPHYRTGAEFTAGPVKVEDADTPTDMNATEEASDILADGRLSQLNSIVPTQVTETITPELNPEQQDIQHSVIFGPRLPLQSDIAQGFGNEDGNSTLSGPPLQPTRTISLPNSPLFNNPARTQNYQYFGPFTNQHTGSATVIQPLRMQEVWWADGHRPGGLPKLPDSLYDTIGRNLGEFERKFVATAWSYKTCEHDKGNKVVHLLNKTPDAEIVSIARYLYGRGKQFLVAWLPDQTAPDSKRPHVVKFDPSLQNSTPFERDGYWWRAAPYSTWAPSHEYMNKTIWRLVAGKQVNPPRPEPSPRVKISLKMSDSGSYEVVGNGSSTEGSQIIRKRPLEDDADRSRQERQHGPIDLTSETSDTEATNHTQLAQIEPDLTQEKTSITDTSPSVRRVSTRLPESVKADRRALYAVKRSSYPISAPLSSKSDKHTIVVQSAQKQDSKKQKLGIVHDFSKVLVICKDAQDKVRGTFPYDECDSAQKLFDVVCVSEIARIEPPATRLLKVSFGNGKEGRIRPDNVNDFENVVSSTLKELMKTTKKGIAITITPYL